MLQVMAFVLFFSCVSACLASVMERFRLSDLVSAIFGGVLEMTSGIGNAASTLSPKAALRLTAFFSGFAGLSVCLQLFSVAEKYRPRLLPYVFAKLAQGLLALGLTQLYFVLCEPTLNVNCSIATFAANHIQQRTTVIVLLLLPALVLLCSLLHLPKRKPSSPR